jgi:GH25 family lysozyme M1 (1,4-beta-N-acetylmuramidase)
MVDVEQDSLSGFTGSTADVIDELQKFDAAVRARLPAGKLPLIYFDLDFWISRLGGYNGFAVHPAWPVAYNNDATLDVSGTGWTNWTIWQHSSSGNLAGIAGNVDLNRCSVSIADVGR